MASEVIRPLESPKASGWFRTYPPLASLVVAIVIVVAVLPSALNVQQPNPNETAEYAPVPPQDDTPPPSTSFSSIGLTTGGGSGPAPVTQIKPPEGPKVKKPQTKHCVEHPDGYKQTEDPNAPPCVPFFDGDNGGVTFQGVTRDEITVLIYQAAYISDQEREGSDTSAGESTPDPGGYCDVELPPSDTNPCVDPNTGQDHSLYIVTRAMSRYFNDRFQTYGRRVHFHIYWTSAGTASGRRAEAADNWTRLKPFAVIDKAFFGGFNDVYAEAMVKRNVSIYGSFGSLTNAFYRKLAPYVWSFYPDVEHWTDSYVSYVCTQLARTPVSYAEGEDIDGQPLNGQKRRYGLLYTTDESYSGLIAFRELVKAGLKQCLPDKGAEIVAEKTYPYAGYAKDAGGDPEKQTYAPGNVADFQRAKVNTILWLGGMEGKMTPAMDAAGYYPEIVVAGDLVMDDLINGREQNQRTWSHARAVSKQLREDRTKSTPGRQAFREAEPNGRQIHEYYANNYYRDFFTLFKAIQVAGPNLSPQSVDKGQHAIPRVKSTNPFVAACFFDPGDYSCVKDANVQWWDPSAPDPNGEAGQGCWRMVQDGQRYLAHDWDGISEPFTKRDDVCNGLKGAVYNRL